MLENNYYPGHLTVVLGYTAVLDVLFQKPVVYILSTFRFKDDGQPKQIVVRSSDQSFKEMLNSMLRQP